MNFEKKNQILIKNLVDQIIFIRIRTAVNLENVVLRKTDLKIKLLIVINR